MSKWEKEDLKEFLRQPIGRREFIIGSAIVAPVAAYGIYEKLKPERGPVEFSEIDKRVEANIVTEGPEIAKKGIEQYIRDNLTFGKIEYVEKSILKTKRGPDGTEPIEKPFTLPPYFAVGFRHNNGYFAAGWANWNAIGLDGFGRSYSTNKLNDLNNRIKPPDILNLNVRQMFWDGDPIVVTYEESATQQKFKFNLMEVWELKDHIDVPSPP